MAESKAERENRKAADIRAAQLAASFSYGGHPTTRVFDAPNQKVTEEQIRKLQTTPKKRGS